MNIRLCCLLLLCVSSATVCAENWPQWRGPKNDGISTEKGLPTSWDAEKNITWKYELPGAGSSTPAVWGDLIFLSCDDGKKVALVCLGTDGKPKWKGEMGASFKSGRGDEGDCASPSPSTDGKSVYVFCGNGQFAAFDFDGKELWRFDAQERYKKFRIDYGMHSTPVLHEGRLYFQLIHDNAAVVACVEAKDGKEVWKVERKSEGIRENKHSYASPVMWTNGKEAYLVTHGNDYAIAHDLKDGGELWRLGDLNPKEIYNPTLRFVASPVCTPELIVVPSAKKGVIVGLKPDAKGKVMSGGEGQLWRNDRGTPDVPSPLVHDGIVYLCGEGGGKNGLTLLDAKSGKNLGQTNTHNHRHRGSPVLADGKLYLQARDGTTTVVAAGKDGKVLATNKLPDQTAAGVAVAGSRVYVRGFKYLWAIEEKK